MFLREDSFEVSENGISIEGGPHIIGGAASPLSLTPTTPTLYVQSNGVVWIHDGATTWKRLGAFNFSFRKVNEPVTIPTNQQMIVQGSFELTANGCLEIEPEGSFVLNKGGT